MGTEILMIASDLWAVPEISAINPLMKTLLAFLVLMASAAPAFAENLFTPDASCACDPKIKDSLEEPIRFAFGKFQGQCVDSCRFRRARILENSSQTLVIGNLLHLGHYVKARIPLNKVESVQVGFERFAPGVDHVVLRFSFSEQLPLFTQFGKVTPAGFTRAIVISSEGVPPKGHKYSMSEGYFGYYLLDHRLATGEEMNQWTVKLHHPVRFVPLKLAQPQAARIHAHGIRRSDSESFASVYQLFANNCSTAALSLLDAETGVRRAGFFPWAELEDALPIAGPMGTEHALQNRGLIEASKI